MLVYVPWCGFSRKFLPVWQAFARAVANVKHLVVAKMDGDQNTSPLPEDFSWTAYPHIFFVKARRASSLGCASRPAPRCPSSSTGTERCPTWSSSRKSTDPSHWISIPASPWMTSTSSSAKRPRVDLCRKGFAEV